MKTKRELTRRQAINALHNGADPTSEEFVSHHNYHVRYVAWRAAGSPLPESPEERLGLARIVAPSLLRHAENELEKFFHRLGKLFALVAE